MSCGGGGVDIANTSGKVKSGYLRRFSKGFFSKGWKNEYVVLFKDSTLAWYAEQGKSKAEGSVIVKNVCNYMCVGPYTQGMPNRPDLPKGANIRQVIAMPSVASKKADKIHWFLCTDDADLNGWMKAICSTLPPPQPPPAQHPAQGQQAPPGGQPYPPPGGQPYPPPPGGAPFAHNAAATGAAPYPQQQGYQQQGYHQHGQNRAGGNAGGNTTVIVQDRGRRNSDDGFLAGMMIGGAVGYGMGHPFGWGYGYGGGYGMYPGYYDFGPDIHVHNHYDVDNTNIQNTEINETNIENNEYNYEQNNYDQGYDQGGYDQGGYDQGGYDQGYDPGYDQGGYEGDGGYDGGFDGGGDGGGCGGDGGGCGGDGGGGCGGGCGGCGG